MYGLKIPKRLLLLLELPPSASAKLMPTEEQIKSNEVFHELTLVPEINSCLSYSMLSTPPPLPLCCFSSSILIYFTPD